MRLLSFNLGTGRVHRECVPGLIGGLVRKWWNLFQEEGKLGSAVWVVPHKVNGGLRSLLKNNGSNRHIFVALRPS